MNECPHGCLNGWILEEQVVTNTSFVEGQRIEKPMLTLRFPGKWNSDRSLFEMADGTMQKFDESKYEYVEYIASVARRCPHVSYTPPTEPLRVEPLAGEPVPEPAGAGRWWDDD